MKKIYLSIGLGTLSFLPLSVAISCGDSSSLTKKKINSDLNIIASHLNTQILEQQLKIHLKNEKDLVHKLNFNGKYKISIEKAVLTNVKFQNQKVSYKIIFNTTKQGVHYTRVEEAKQSPLKIISEDSLYKIKINIATTQLNNRIKSTLGRTNNNMLSIRELLGKWDDQLVGISLYQKSNIVKNIKLFHTNDSHGRLAEDAGKYNKYIGMDRIAGYVSHSKHDLFLSGGDFMQGTGVSNLDQGKRAMDIASLMGYDAIASGNHEFDFGYKTLLKRAKVAPIYSTNTLYNKDINENKIGDEALPGVRTKIIKGNLPVGIISLTTPDVATKVSPANIVDIKMESMYLAAQREVTRFTNAGIKLIIVVGHMGNDAASTETSEALVKHVKGIDLIIDGHSHQLYKPGRKVKRDDHDVTYLTQTGAYTRNLGQITFDFDRQTGKITKFSNKYIDFDQMAKLKPQKIQAIEDIVQKAKDAYREFAKKVVFKMPNALTDGIIQNQKQVRTVRKFEASSGDFFADALLWLGQKNPRLQKQGTIIGVTNGGGVRTSVEKGDVTKGEITALSPFNNTAEGVLVTGKQLWAIFNHSAKQWNDGGFLQISKNMQVDYQVFKAKLKDGRETTDYNKVTSISIAGEDVAKDSTKVYVMMTNDFMKGGGDGYKALTTKLPTVFSGGTLSDELANFGVYLANKIVGDNFSWNDYPVNPITPETSQRIHIVGGDEKAKTFIKSFNQ